MVSDIKNLNYKDLKLISLNVAGWNWRITNEKWRDRLIRICEYIRKRMDNPLVVALQEVQLSGGRYLKVLEEQFPNYYIVLPQAYKNQPRSVISVLLINKELCESYSIRTLDGLEDSCRYNYVQINTHIEGLCFRILNINIPHNCLDNAAEWYRREREVLRDLFISRIKELACIYHSESDVKFIILGDFNTLPEDEFIDSLVYSYDRPMLDAVKKHEQNISTWKNPVTQMQSRLDYIFYSNGMLSNTGLSAKVTEIDDSTIAQGLSDHAVLYGGLSFDFS